VADATAADARSQAVHDFFVQLKKGAKSMALYQHQHSRFAEFLKPAAVALARLLEAGPLSLKVTAESLLLGEVPVLGETVPGRLFREGVRHLTLRPGIAEAELLKLTAILFSPERSGDSLVTNFYDAGFQSVEYVVVEGFKVGDLSEEETQVEVDKIVDYLYSRLRGQTEDTLAFARVMASDLDLKLEGIDVIRGVLFDGDEVSAAFKQKLQQELQQDEAVRMHRQLVGTLLVGLRTGVLTDPKPVVEILVQMIDGMLLQEDYKPIARILSELGAMATAAGGPSSAAGEVHKGVAKELGAMARVARFAEALKTNPNTDAASIAACLAALDESALGAMADAMETLEQPEHRALFVDALAAVGHDKPEFFLARLNSQKPQTVRNMVAIIDKARFSGAGKYIATALKNPNPMVRAEIAAILGGSQDGAAVHGILLQATTDKDAHVRAAAFRAIAQAAPMRAAADLMRLPKLPDWDKRPDEEKALIFSCLGATEQPDVLRYLAGLLQQKKSLLHARKILESKFLAVKALSCMENLQAVRLLQMASEARDEEPELATAARKAMIGVKKVIAERTRAAVASTSEASAEAHAAAQTGAAADALFQDFSQAKQEHAAESAEAAASAARVREKMAAEEIEAARKAAERRALELAERELRRLPTPPSMPAVLPPGAPPTGDEEIVDLEDEVDEEGVEKK
jgi:hypothetical protein